MSYYREVTAYTQDTLSSAFDFTLQAVLGVLNYLYSFLPDASLPSEWYVFLGYIEQALTYLNKYFPVDELFEIFLYVLYFHAILIIFDLTKKILIFLRSGGSNM